MIHLYSQRIASNAVFKALIGGIHTVSTIVQQGGRNSDEGIIWEKRAVVTGYTSFSTNLDVPISYSSIFDPIPAQYQYQEISGTKSKEEVALWLCDKAYSTRYSVRISKDDDGTSFIDSDKVENAGSAMLVLPLGNVDGEDAGYCVVSRNSATSSGAFISVKPLPPIKSSGATLLDVVGKDADPANTSMATHAATSKKNANNGKGVLACLEPEDQKEFETLLALRQKSGGSKKTEKGMHLEARRALERCPVN